MPGFSSWRRWLGAFVFSLCVGTILASVVQTQFNLLSVQAMGLPMPLLVRLQTSLLDLVFFGPVLLILLGSSFLVSQCVALWLARWLHPLWHPWLCALGATIGLWASLALVNALAPMPTLIAATRSGAGSAAMLACAALAGWLFARWSPPFPRASSASVHPSLSLFLVLGSALIISDTTQAQSSGEYRVETVAEGLEHPWSLAFLPDGGLLVTERPGRLRLIDDQGRLRSISGLPKVYAEGQSGLFDVMLAEDFGESRQLYLSYACGDYQANHTCLARGRLQEKEGALTDVEELFRTQPAKVASAHFGGRLAWLPDGTLVLTLGDGFDYREQAQNPANHLGGTVRLNADGSVPQDNPFLNQNSARPELYTLGHRNIQGLFLDPESGTLFSHEHGPKGGDELNVLQPGENYGWPAVTHGLDYTGARVSPYTEWDGLHAPLWHWTPSIAPSGLTLYRGELFPQWQGSLLVGGLASRRVHRLKVEASEAREVDTLFAELEQRIRDIRTGPEGALYLLTDHQKGKVLRVVPAR